MANGKLNVQAHEDALKSALFTSATTADWIRLKGPNQEVYIIVDDADPNGSTNYDAAGVGSLFIRTSAGSAD